MATGERPVMVADGKHIRFMRAGSWEYASRKGVSGVIALVPVTDDGKLVLVEQYRPPVEARVIELPAGLAGDGRKTETLEEAARRELAEETGYAADTLEYVGGGAASAGICDELISMFVARGLSKVGPDAAEQQDAETIAESARITVHEVPLDTITTFLAEQERRGTFVDLKIYAGLYFAGRPVGA
jgi:ADP-ribose pyrophosphatase